MERQNYVVHTVSGHPDQASPLNSQWASRTGTNTSWTTAPIAVMNSGGIRGSFGVGPITMADVLTVMPFENSVDKILIEGRYLVRKRRKSIKGACVNGSGLGRETN